MDKNLYNRWKAAITEDQQQSRDPHKASAVFRSFVNFIFGTNETDLSKVLPMEVGERRFVSFLVSSAISDKSEAEKTAYFARLLTADVRPLARYLMTHPTIRRGEPFLTDATFQAKMDALDHFEQWWYQCLKQGFIRSNKKESERDVFSWLEPINLQNRSRAIKERVYSCYLEFAQGSKLLATMFWKRMSQFNAGDSTVRDSRNVRYIEFNTLAQCRSAFAVKMGAQLPWFNTADDRGVAEEAVRTLDQFLLNPNAAAVGGFQNVVDMMPSIEQMQAQMMALAAPAPAAPAPAAPAPAPAAQSAAFDYNSGSSDTSDMEDDDEESHIDEKQIQLLADIVLSPADARRQTNKLPIGEGDEHDPDQI